MHELSVLGLGNGARGAAAFMGLGLLRRFRTLAFCSSMNASASRDSGFDVLTAI
jgi:hypothetical protein